MAKLDKKTKWNNKVKDTYIKQVDEIARYGVLELLNN